MRFLLSPWIIALGILIILVAFLYYWMVHRRQGSAKIEHPAAWEENPDHSFRGTQPSRNTATEPGQSPSLHENLPSHPLPNQAYIGSPDHVTGVYRDTSMSDPQPDGHNPTDGEVTPRGSSDTGYVPGGFGARVPYGPGHSDDCDNGKGVSDDEDTAENAQGSDQEDASPADLDDVDTQGIGKAKEMKDTGEEKEESGPGKDTEMEDPRSDEAREEGDHPSYSQIDPDCLSPTPRSRITPGVLTAPPELIHPTLPDPEELFRSPGPVQPYRSRQEPLSGNVRFQPKQRPDEAPVMQGDQPRAAGQGEIDIFDPSYSPGYGPSESPAPTNDSLTSGVTSLQGNRMNEGGTGTDIGGRKPSTWSCTTCGNQSDMRFIYCTECGHRRV